MSETRLVPMGKLLNLIEAAGFNLEYHFDDLVFIDNTSLLFRFDKGFAEKVYVHFNVECEKKVSENLIAHLKEKSVKESLEVELAENFELSQVEGKEEIAVIFKP